VSFAYDVAADSHGNVWVSDSRQASVARITAMTQGFPVAPAPPERIRVPVRAGALAVGGGYLWVANAAYSAAGRTIGQRTVSRIDLRDRRFITPVPVGELPVAIAFGYGAAWVAAGYGSDSMSIIRTGSSTPQSLVLPLQADDFAETVAVGAGSVWVVTQEGTIFRIDPETRRIVATIRARTVAKESFGIAVGAGFVWVVDRGDSTLTQVDPRTNHIVRRIRLGSVGVVPCGVAATATAVWVTIASDTDCGSIATR
jgi:streptogramin lyase